MKRVVLLFALSTFMSAMCKGQPQGDSAKLVALNQQIDDYVVQKNVDALAHLYASDFVFSHGSGKVEGRAGWLKTVANAEYPLRRHDSVTVELHPGLAVVKGKLTIEKINKGKTDRYYLKYIRIYATRPRDWQLVSHSTTQEWHEP